MRYRAESLSADVIELTKEAIAAPAEYGYWSPITNRLRNDANRQLRLPTGGTTSYYVLRPDGRELIFDGARPVESIADREQVLGDAVFVAGRHLTVPPFWQKSDRVHLQPLRTNPKTGRVLSQLRNPEIELGINPDNLANLDIVEYPDTPDGYLGVRGLVCAGLVLNINQLERQPDQSMP